MIMQVVMFLWVFAVCVICVFVHVASCRIVLHHTISYRIAWHHIISHHIVPYHCIVWYPIPSYPILNIYSIYCMYGPVLCHFAWDRKCGAYADQKYTTQGVSSQLFHTHTHTCQPRSGSSFINRTKEEEQKHTLDKKQPCGCGMDV